MKNSSIRILFLAAIIFCAVSFPEAQAAVGGTTFTTSTTHHDAFTDVFLDPSRIDNFFTRIMAQLAGGPIFFDQSFNLKFSDAIVQAAVSNAQNILNTAGAAAISGPNLIFSQEDFLGSVTSLINQQLNHQENSVTTTTTIGPATILIGEDQADTFFVPAGTLNINTNTHTENFIDRQFQNQDSYLTKEHYDLTGRLQAEPVVTPEPGTFLLLSLGLAGIGLFQFKK